MYKRFKHDLSDKIFDTAPLNLKKTFYEIELYYLIRELVNKANLGKCADIGDNGMMTGVCEYDYETYMILEVIKEKYRSSEKLKKAELFNFVKQIFEKAFCLTYVDNFQGKMLTEMIYNEIYKLEKHQGRTTLPSNPFKLDEYEFAITTSKEFDRNIYDWSV